ncbi:MAG: hypothetical protein AAF798_01345 [Bacteroidota bacterium]
MSITHLVIKVYCWLKGLKVAPLEEMEAQTEAFELRNRIYSEVYGFQPVMASPEVIRPKGLAYYVGIYRKGKLVACMRLMDPTEITPFVSFFYDKPQLDKPFDETYEMAGLVIEPKLQSSDSSIFLILLYHAFQFTIQNGRSYWLASTWKSLYHYIKRMGGIAEFITDKVGFEDDGSAKANFLKNYLENGSAKDYCCYYVYLPKNYDRIILKKYFQRQKRKLLKRWKQLSLNGLFNPKIKSTV